MSAEPLVHELDSRKKKKSSPKMIIAAVVIILLGIGSGYGLSKVTNSRSTSTGGGTNVEVTTDTSGKTQSVGSKDTKTFSDSAEGELQEGGIKGEGTHKLVRPGGDSQTVYLTSSVLDLNQFVGKKVKVWGQTFTGKKVGWLMDVGKVEVL